MSDGMKKQPEYGNEKDTEIALSRYAQEFDAGVYNDYRQRYDEQERQRRYKEARETYAKTRGTWLGMPSNDTEAQPWSRQPEPMHSESKNMFGLLACFLAFFSPLLGYIFGYLAIRKARVTGQETRTARFAFAISTLMVLVNMYLVLTGKITITS